LHETENFNFLSANHLKPPKSLPISRLFAAPGPSDGDAGFP
jgi:hypothetical protein